MTEFNRERAEQLIKEARAREYSQHELELAKLLEQTLGFDSERRTYYDNYKLVKDDWNTLRAALDKLTRVLVTYRESDHSFDRAPTPEAQAVLDTWDDVAKTLSVRNAELAEWRDRNDKTRLRLVFLESEVRKYEDAHQEDLRRIEGLRTRLAIEEEERLIFSVGCSRLERLHDQLRGFIVEKGLIEDFDNRYPRDEKSNT